MKLGIEAGSFYGKRSGVGRYALKLTQALMANRPDDEFNLISFLRPGKQPDIDFEVGPRTSYHYIKLFPGRIFSVLMRSGLSTPMELLGVGGSDLYLFPNFISWASLTRRTKVCVVHDVAFLLYPEYIQAKNLKYLQKQLPKSMRRSSHIIAVSEATKLDITIYYGVDASKITVVPNAVDLDHFNVSAKDRLDEVRTTHGLPDSYILYVGNVEPRKNLIGLIDAYEKSYPEHQLPLVIVGAKGWNNEKLDERLSQLPSLPIIFTDFVNDDDLPTIYTGASIFIYPSHYEGFGLPVLEAMACGTPVICSNTSSLPEIAGEAAIQVTPGDIDELAGAMTQLIKDDALRTKLIAAGHEQAKKYTWDASAQILSNLIDKIGGR